MSLSRYSLFQQHARPRIDAAMQALVGQPPTLFMNEDRYLEEVTLPAWREVPLPLRLFGRKRWHWDELFLALRFECFVARQGKIALQPDAGPRLTALVERLFEVEPTPPAAAPPPVPGTPAAPLPSAPVVPAAPPARKAVRTKGPVVALGIDLGTTYSVVAHLDEQGRPWTIPNATGELLTPSVVLIDDFDIVVGKEAVQAAAMEPERVAECVKRDMGAPMYRKPVNDEHYPPQVLSSFILRELKADAERKLGAVGPAVITVPAYFDEPRRRATMEAGQLAELDVLDILNEPTAAALAYGYQLGFLDRHGKATGGRGLRVLVYDLGGGTFDVTILDMGSGSFRALATDGDVSLGGKDWDEKLVELAAEEFRRVHREDPRTNPVSHQELWLAAETAKRTLTERSKATIFVNHLGVRQKVEVTREQFEEATVALLGRTRTTTEIVVRQAGLTWPQIDRVLLVGGSTRMPMVARMLEQLLGRPAERALSPDESVAHGAALYAELLLHQRGPTGGPPRFAVTNVSSHDLRIVGVDRRTGRRRTQQLIAKNTPLPHTATQVFKTHKAGQRNVVLRVVEGESERPEACTPVGTCTIRALPEDLPAGWPVQVSYTYETNGRLRIAARLQGHSAGVSTEFARVNTLEDREFALWTECLAAGA